MDKKKLFVAIIMAFVLFRVQPGMAQFVDMRCSLAWLNLLT